MLSEIFNKIFKKDSVYSNRSIISQFNEIMQTGLYCNDFKKLYRTNGIAKKIVDCVVDDGLRQWIECDKLILYELQRLEARKKIMKASKIARLTGGAIICAMIDDDQSFDKPLIRDISEKLSFIKKIHSLHVYSKEQINFQDSKLNDDPFDKDFLLPETFAVKIAFDKAIKIHRSRCIVFFGDEDIEINSELTKQNFFGISALEKAVKALGEYEESLDAGLATQRDFVQVVFKIDRLIEQMQTDEGVRGIGTRLKALTVLIKNFGVKNIFPIDSSEDYSKHSSSVGGFAEITDRIAEKLSASTGIPIAKLLGRTSGGLNATGDADMQQYYDLVRSWRNDQATNAINYIIELIFAQKTFDQSINNTWEFPSLTVPSELEQAEIRKKYAEIDCMYADRNAIDLRDAYKARFGPGKFHENIKINTMSTDELEADIADMDLMINQEEIKQELQQSKLERKLSNAEHNL